MERQLARKKAEAAIPLRTNDNGYNPSPQAKAPPPPEAKINEPLPPLDLSNWDLAEVPERDWAVRDRIIRRAVTLLSGEGGVGKSILTLQLACATVLGKDWFGSLPEPGPAIFLDAEDDRDELHFRLNTIRRRLGVTFKDLADEGLHLRAGALAGARRVSISRHPGEPGKRWRPQAAFHRFHPRPRDSGNSGCTLWDGS